MAISIDLATPVRWQAQHFWGRRGRRVYGIVLAFCPTTLAIGGELWGSRTTARGVAAFIGPFWIGVATLAAEASDNEENGDG